MTASLDADRRAARAEEFFNQDLAQFEPDPDGDGSIEAPPAADVTADDPQWIVQWIVWSDAVGESEWAASELGWTDELADTTKR